MQKRIKTKRQNSMKTKNKLIAMAILATGYMAIGQTINNVGPAYPGTPGALNGFNAQLQTAQDNILMLQGGNVFQSNGLRNNFKLGIGVFPGANAPLDRLHLNELNNADVRMRFTNGFTGLGVNDGLVFGTLANGNAIINQQENLPMLFFTNALERMRIFANGNIGINNTLGSNRVHITSGTGNPYFGAPGGIGSSGLRLANLTSANNVSSGAGISGSKVLSVDANGDVILVAPNGSGGPSSVTAKNGLNTTVGAPDVELGGPLVHHTDVNFNNFNQAWVGTGAFGVTDGIASSAINSGLNKFLVNSNTAAKTLNVINGVNGATGGTITGGHVSVLGSNGGNNLGLDIEAANNTQNNTGIKVNSGNPNFGTSAELNNYGVISTAQNASPSGVNIGGEFNGVSPNVLGQQAVANYGVVAYANYGLQNLGVYSRNYNGKGTGTTFGVLSEVTDFDSPNSLNTGVAGYIDSRLSPFGNFGVTGAVSASCLDGSIGVAGVIGTGGAYVTRISQGGLFLNIGVYGKSLIGALANTTNNPLNNNYFAGYFDGNVQINGDAICTANSWTSSDQRFKSNIKKLESTTDKLKRLNGYSYSFNVDQFKEKNFPKTEQIGLIAQELQKEFPQLVREGLDGYLAVNYQGMVPILLEAIKEQSSKMDAQQKQIEDLKQLVQTLAISATDGRTQNTSSVELSDKNVVVLNQNVPNPFAESTVITYNLSTDFEKAQLHFYTLNGKLIKSVNITEKGEGKMVVYANDLSGGTYTYSLVVDGKTIDTKKMVKE
jgi:trimeric autotransporter adhesin